MKRLFATGLMATALMLGAPSAQAAEYHFPEMPGKWSVTVGKVKCQKPASWVKYRICTGLYRGTRR